MFVLSIATCTGDAFSSIQEEKTGIVGSDVVVILQPFCVGMQIVAVGVTNRLDQQKERDV